MNRYKSVRNPRFEIAESDSRTVLNRIRSDVQDFIILKILVSLKALKTDNPDLSLDCTNSSKLRMTMMASKILNPSEQYTLMPRPNSLSTISNANIKVNT
jgi:hypothetical protein